MPLWAITGTAAFCLGLPALKFCYQLVCLGEGIWLARRGDGPVLHWGDSVYVHIVMSTSAAPFAASAQSFLQEGSRLLLMLAMALFMAYLLFLLCAVVISSAATRIRNRHQNEGLPATRIALPAQTDARWGSRPIEAVDDRALSA